jgi:hypothetical protein
MSTFYFSRSSTPVLAVVFAGMVLCAVGQVTGGSAQSGSVTGGTVQGGVVTPGTVTAGTVTATVEGREIRAVAKEPVTINTVGSQATVNIGSHVLVVGKDKLQLDQGMPSSLPEGTKRLEIDVVEEMLTVKADGKEVLRAKMDDPKKPQ